MSKDNVKGVNMKGHEFDPNIAKVVKVLLHFKQGAILSKCRHILHHIEQFPATSTIPKDKLIEWTKDRISKQLAFRLLDDIQITEIERKYQVDNNPDIDATEIKFQTELLVFDPESFKHAVEYCIKEIPLESLLKIKNEPAI